MKHDWNYIPSLKMISILKHTLSFQSPFKGSSTFSTPYKLPPPASSFKTPVKTPTATPVKTPGKEKTLETIEEMEVEKVEPDGSQGNYSYNFVFVWFPDTCVYQ